MYTLMDINSSRTLEKCVNLYGNSRRPKKISAVRRNALYPPDPHGKILDPPLVIAYLPDICLWLVSRSVADFDLKSKVSSPNLDCWKNTQIFSNNPTWPPKKSSRLRRETAPTSPHWSQHPPSQNSGSAAGRGGGRHLTAPPNFWSSDASEIEKEEN